MVFLALNFQCLFYLDQVTGDRVMEHYLEIGPGPDIGLGLPQMVIT